MVWSIHLPGDGGFVQLKLPVFWSVNYRFKTWHLKLNTKTEISVRGTLYTSVGICDDIAAHTWLSDFNSSQNKKGIELCLPDFLSLRFFSADQAPKYNPLELQNHVSWSLQLARERTTMQNALIPLSVMFGHVYVLFHCQRSILQYIWRRTSWFDCDFGWDKTPPVFWC